ncbi:MAG TPA: hypothetical protein VFC42_16705 [Methylomirabilota bacterium]|nr:hypothetical protein [Methylomirabilota bacterium]
MTAIRVARFVAGWSHVPVDRVRVRLVPLRGGLEATIMRADVRLSDVDGTGRTFSLVVKELRGVRQRESRVYRDVLPGQADAPAPRLLAQESDGGRSYLYLEYVRPWRRWPWRDTALAGLVIRELVRVHTRCPVSVCPRGWDYEAELRRSA